MRTPPVTLCPPSQPRSGLHFDKAQFSARRRLPVEAHYVGARNGVNGWVSASGISFDDYRNMTTMQRRTVGRIRRLETPDFMKDERRFRAVVIRYLEIKAGFQTPQNGTEVERTLRFTVAMKTKAERAEQNLDKFAALYVAATDDAERERLQQLIQEYDASIRVYREPAVIPQICRAYYFERLDSCDVADRFGFKAPHVRKILQRLQRLDARMQVTQ
jgi:hypothetical protein